MDQKIQVLSDLVANQIAAGEVVQRPASVVKELLENAIDAGASKITLNIKDAGKTLVQVIDNGEGMSEFDARLSLERHATSKISKVEDIFEIHTMGFRGEALASIAAVSQLDLRTRRISDELGTEIKVDGGNILSQEGVSCDSGSSIAVKNLFHNVPARRKFLKSDNVENRHIIEAFQHVAFCHPDISFQYFNNGNETYQLEKSNLKKRIIQLFGKRFDERLIPIQEQTDIVNITGFITKPEYATAKKGEQLFQVNRRFIKSPYFHHAVILGYEEVLPKDSHPQYFISFEMDPQQIDVNIHPTKTEVKFIEERSIYAILRTIVRQSLGKYNIAPSIDFERENAFELPEKKDFTSIKMPEIKVNPGFNPFKANDHFLQEKADTTPSVPAPEESAFEQVKLQEVRTATLKPSDIDGTKTGEDTRKSKIIQLHNKFILTHIKSGFMVIDQYRAHQRVLYDQFMVQEGNLPSQQMLFPKMLELTEQDAQELHTLTSEIEQLGFSFESLGKNTVSINGAPPGINEDEIEPVFMGMLEQYRLEEKLDDKNIRSKLAKALARKMAIKSGQQLTEEEMERLVDKLFACDMPYNLPNGKPIIVTLPIEDLEKRFQY